MTMTLQVRQRSTLTLPAAIRNRYNIQTDDSFRLVDLDGALALTPLAPPIPEPAREIERARLEAGLSAEEMLATSASNANVMSSKSTAQNPHRPRIFVDDVGTVMRLV